MQDFDFVCFVLNQSTSKLNSREISLISFHSAPLQILIWYYLTWSSSIFHFLVLLAFKLFISHIWLRNRSWLQTETLQRQSCLYWLYILSFAVMRTQQSERLRTRRQVIVVHMSLNVNEGESFLKKNDQHACRNMKVVELVFLYVWLLFKSVGRVLKPFNKRDLPASCKYW